jgi:hypothetical protein
MSTIERTAGDIQAAHLAWSRAQPARGGCLFCPDFQPTGTCAEVQEACAEHRASVHPELSKKRRRRRHTFSGLTAFSQKLTQEESEEINENRARRLRLLGIEPEG